MPKEPTLKRIDLKIKPDHDIEPKRIYANYAAIDHTGFDFTIRFCDVAPPFAIKKGSKDVSEMEHRVPIVAEIAVPFQMVPGLIKALEDQYDKFQTIVDASKKREADNEKQNK